MPRQPRDVLGKDVREGLPQLLRLWPEDVAVVEERRRLFRRHEGRPAGVLAAAVGAPQVTPLVLMLVVTSGVRMVVKVFALAAALGAHARAEHDLSQRPGTIKDFDLIFSKPRFLFFCH